MVEHLVGSFEADTGFVQALLDLLELDVHGAAACTFLSVAGVILLLPKRLFGMNSLLSTDHDELVAQQLDNLANMAERVASPAFKQSFRAGVVARAKAANSYVAYMDKQGRLIREWPATGIIEVVST